jgi:hypothetical protein
MKKSLFLFILFILPVFLSARIIYVDINGSGQFTSIQSAINAAVNGDTIKVLPGIYDGQLTIGKNVVIQGSGYEVTTITSKSDPTITMSSGKIMWFSITSNSGDGIVVSSGIITNCIIRGCSKNGINLAANSNANISNCILIYNGEKGIKSTSGTSSSAYNCISYQNSSDGFYSWGGYGGTGFIVNYCLGSISYTSGNIGDIDVNPNFTAVGDYHISSTSPCWDKGKPDVYDPDGSRSDMGYFGGPDCSIFPVVTEVKIIQSGSNGVQIQAKARANY